MEPISFTLALAGIPGIFTSCVECYQYIQFGRVFEQDFELSWCKLEAAELRLTRWGTSMGIEGPETKLHHGYNEDDIKVAYRWLYEIRKAFDSAIEASARFGKIASPAKLQLLNKDIELRKGSSSLQGLHNHMRSIVDQRVKPRKRDRISWALYQKGTFEDLIETISVITTNLEELFPSTINAQKELCKNEVTAMDTESIILWDKAVGDDDKIFKMILQTEAQQRPNFFSNIEVRDHFRGHFGDRVASGERSRSNVYSGISAGGHAVAHFGNTIGNTMSTAVLDAPQD